MLTTAFLAAASAAVPLAPEAAAAASQIAVETAAKGGVDYVELVLKASVPVQIVLLLLLFGSIYSWIIIFRKTRVYQRADNETDEFEGRFWSGADLNQLYRAATDRNRSVEGLEAIFEAGFREYTRLRQKKGMDARAQLEGAQRAMRATFSREAGGLERNLEMLANIGSTAPYVGLVGTVWGIMIAFHELGNVEQATMAQVAPHISEALIATAMGLFAAIPAVWAYNRFSSRVERLLTRYEAFAEDFSSILARQGASDEH